MAGKYGSIHIWNVDTGALLHGDDEDRPSRADMFSLAFSFDDSSIICGDASGQIEIYRISDGSLLHRFPDAHSGPVSGVALTPDGKRIASCSWEKTLHIWDVDSDRDSSVAVRLESSLGYAICVALTSDGGCAVAGSVHSGGIAVWDVQTGALAEEEIAAVLKQLYTVEAVVFSPNERYVATAMTGHAVNIWDVKTRAVVYGPLLGHRSRTLCVKFSPDGKYLVSGAFNGSMRVWDVSSLLDEPIDNLDPNPSLPHTGGLS